MHSHAERGNDQAGGDAADFILWRSISTDSVPASPIHHPDRFSLTLASDFHR